jgi:dihydrofolate reductase
MKNVKIIAATDLQGIIGIDGQIPWHYPWDLRRFKRVTMGGTLVMGSRTWESLPGKLPGRDHIILTRDLFYGEKGLPEGVWTESNILAAIKGAQETNPNNPIWIAGGGEVYRQILEMEAADEAILTLIPETISTEGAKKVVRFPLEMLDSFTLIEEMPHPKDPRLTLRQYRAV